MKKTQCELVLEALKDGPKSQQEIRGFTHNRVQNITGRISDLRDKGYIIEAEDAGAPHGVSFARFVLKGGTWQERNT